MISISRTEMKQIKILVGLFPFQLGESKSHRSYSDHTNAIDF